MPPGVNVRKQSSTASELEPNIQEGQKVFRRSSMICSEGFDKYTFDCHRHDIPARSASTQKTSIGKNLTERNLAGKSLPDRNVAAEKNLADRTVTEGDLATERHLASRNIAERNLSEKDISEEILLMKRI
ncbi:hypothetical protein CEXT_183691 [Caerostris extrusa]|uniref:Uncharacterized protein n=1 Tax=Caerostris extrusa TaxID=172846 RepID=A0AAV4YDH0_CAEEX|nr:hypothetical protein CEXT_183691 [Caerostris extrusa]